jgi:hypothetical protein
VPFPFRIALHSVRSSELRGRSELVDFTTSLTLDRALISPIADHPYDLDVSAGAPRGQLNSPTLADSPHRGWFDSRSFLSMIFAEGLWGHGAGVTLCCFRLLGLAGKDARCYPSNETLGVRPRPSHEPVRARFIVAERLGAPKKYACLFVWTSELERLRRFQSGARIPKNPGACP